MQKLNQILMKKFLDFRNWIVAECRDRRTIVLFFLVMIVMNAPVWGGYLLFFLTGWKWAGIMASAYFLFWAGPFTPFIPICIAITLALKKIMEQHHVF